MSTAILNVSTSDTHISSTAKSLKTIDVDDVKKEDVEYGTSKSVQVNVRSEEVYEGKEVEIEESPKVTQSADAETEEAVDDDTESAEEQLFRAEMDLALAHVRKLALFQKEALVNSICDTFASFNQKEASINDISAIFGRIKAALAEEAAEDEEDAEWEEQEADSDIDSDYHPNDDRFDYDLDLDCFEEEDVSDPDDSDYDPKDPTDVEQVLQDMDEDGTDDESENAEEEKLETISFDEEAIINSESFDAEYFEAIQCAVDLGKLDKAKMYEKISKKYQSEFGDEVIEEAFEQFVDFEFVEEVEAEETDAVGDESEEEVDVNSEEYRKEMAEALYSVRELAAKHQESLVDEICGAFKSLNGSEPSVSELSSIFSAIKMEFAEETRKEFLDDIEEESEEEEEEQEEVVNID